MVVALRRGCHMYKVDLSRAYRQLRSDPWDWPLLWINWNDDLYLDVAIPFGLRHGVSACQLVSEAVAAIAKHDVHTDAHAYIDDTAGAALPDVALTHYRSILGTMDTLGLDRAPDKCQPPDITLTWVGVFLDSIKMTMSTDKDRVLEALHLCENFLVQHSVSLKYMQRFVGKVKHVINCECIGWYSGRVRVGRVELESAEYKRKSSLPKFMAYTVNCLFPFFPNQTTRIPRNTLTYGQNKRIMKRYVFPVEI